MPKTRLAWPMSVLAFAAMVSCISGVMGLTLPWPPCPTYANLQNFATRSGAPFKEKSCPPSSYGSAMNMYLLAESNGISKSVTLSMTSLTRFTPHAATPAFIRATSVGEPMNFSPVPITVALLRTEPRSILDGNVVLSAGSVLLKSVTVAIAVADEKCTMSRRFMSPLVRVPVLSEHTTETQPSVSTASNLRTSTFRADIFWDAIIREIVTVGMRPSGTWANKAPAALARMYPIG
mmetsp:Transcript_8374/g.21360  ORF Transcript_8374/g.21360 Transcript_8374/m.21360 type:complete len:235 (+) Transcript_8374:1540-2244(+)